MNNYNHNGNSSNCSGGGVEEMEESSSDVGEEQRVALARQKVEQLVEENAVVVFSESGCCMCHVVKRLLCSLGVSPTVHELDHHADGAYMEKALRLLEAEPPPPPSTQNNNNRKINSNRSSSAADDTAAVPTVFVGGKLLGGLDKVLATHVSGDLVPQLKQAGALWL
jgi:glutaredoxin 3